MKEKRFSTKEKTALIVLLVLMAAVIGVGAYIIINNVNTANEQAKNPTNVTVTGDTSLLIEKETSKTNDNQPEATNKTLGNTEKETEAVVKSDTKSSKTSSDTSSKTTSKTSSNTNSKSNTSSKTNSQSSNSKIPVIKPDSNSSHASKDVCLVNGTKCYVGDTITIALNIKTPKVLENFQGFTEYDSEYLKFESAKANVSGLVNNHESTIYYNGSNISTGFDFTSTGTLYTATFKVLKKGETSIKNTMEILTDMKDVAVSPDKCTISIKVYN